MFSSGAATWGSGQQAAYAAANHYLDALAHHRHHDHKPATTIAWGLWGDVGMVADEASTAFLARFGVHPIPPGLATKALQQAVTAGTTTLTVANIDWAQFIPTFAGERAEAGIDESHPARQAQPRHAGRRDARERGRRHRGLLRHLHPFRLRSR
jgi:hypothetical protein